MQDTGEDKPAEIAAIDNAEQPKRGRGNYRKTTNKGMTYKEKVDPYEESYTKKLRMLFGKKTCAHCGWRDAGRETWDEDKNSYLPICFQCRREVAIPKEHLFEGLSGLPPSQKMRIARQRAFAAGICVRCLRSVVEDDGWRQCQKCLGRDEVTNER